MQPLSSSIFRAATKSDAAPTHAVMTTAAAALFVLESLAPNTMSRFREGSASPGVPRTHPELEGWSRSVIRIWCFGARRPDCFCRSQDYGSSYARLPANHVTVHWVFDESRIAGSQRRIFWRMVRRAAVKSRSSFVLEIQLRQPDPVQQHDLPLGLAKEAEDTPAVKI